MDARSVIVVMPWGGDSDRRRAILNFKRVEYLLLNKCKVKTKSGETVGYAVKPARTTLDAIHDAVLEQIRKADVLLALFTSPNSNVSYEVSHWLSPGPHLRRKLVLVAHTRSDLPVYVDNLPFCAWKHSNIDTTITKIADAASPDLVDFTAGIPDDLKRDIDSYDSAFQSCLEQKLQAIEEEFAPEPVPAVYHLRGIVSTETIRFYAASIVKFSFLRRGEFDPRCPGEVIDWDNEFARVYGYSSREAAKHDAPLTLDKLLARIWDPEKPERRFLDENDWTELGREQHALHDTVIKNYGFARATIPFKFNANHTDDGFRNKWYLPCTIAQVIDGKIDRPHVMYLLVVYIELPRNIRK
jgi:hypothetical protein